jgi:CrcB protein
VNALLWIGVAAISGVGAVLRVELTAAVAHRRPTALPQGTLAVNVLGSFLLGVLHGAGLAGDWLLLAGTALLGSFTTFSTWMVEAEGLREQQRHSAAFANVALSLALGLGAAALGWCAAALV